MVVGISVVEDAVVTDVVTDAVVSEDVGIVVEVRVSDFEVTTVDVVSSVVEGVVDEAVVVVSAIVLSEVVGSVVEVRVVDSEVTAVDVVGIACCCRCG